MRIKRIETKRVTVPFEAPIIWSQGYRDATTRTLVWIHTDEGITGIGETRGDNGIEEMIRSMSKKLIGEDPYQIELILEKFHMMAYFQGYYGLSAVAGIEMALWDIMGKAADRQLCDLIGGKYRDKVSFSGYVFFRYKSEDGKGGEQSAEEIIKFCEEIVEQYGFDCLKLKGGVFHPSKEIEVLRAIRNRFGSDFRLRIDPNGCWSPQTAIWVSKELEKIGLEYLEDPCWGIEGMSKLRKDISIPIATNMCVVNFDTLPTGIRENACDIILADAHKWGGISVTKKLAAVCNAFRIGMSMHAGAELGVSTAVNIHLAASTPEINYSVDSHYHHELDDIIKGGKHKYVNGYMNIPDGPGIGVEFDMERIEKYHNLFLRRTEAASVIGEVKDGRKHLSRSQY